jgi:hypothetical protein
VSEADAACASVPPARNWYVKLPTEAVAHVSVTEAPSVTLLVPVRVG